MDTRRNRRAVKTAVLTHAAGEAADARDKAQQRRRVSVTPDADGMAWISACIRDLDAHRIYHRLTAAGAAHKADPLTMTATPTNAAPTCSSPSCSATAPTLPTLTAPPTPDSPTGPDSSGWATRRTDSSDGSRDARTAKPAVTVAAVLLRIVTPVPDSAPARSASGPTRRHACWITLDTLLGLADTPADVSGMGRSQPTWHVNLPPTDAGGYS